jgi:hypothetical protein
MKLLTATRERQGEQDGDFCFAAEGELVLLGFVCAADEADPDGGCGCGRAVPGPVAYAVIGAVVFPRPRQSSTEG